MATDRKITVLIAEDQSILRLGLTMALGDFMDVEIVGQCADGPSVLRDAFVLKPDVIVMDIGLPQINGIQATKEIKDSHPEMRIIMFTLAKDPDTISAAFAAGADGYCFKDVPVEHLYAAVKAVILGVTWLDPGVADLILRNRVGVHPLIERMNISGEISRGLLEPIEPSPQIEFRPETSAGSEQSSSHKKFSRARAALSLSTASADDEVNYDPLDSPFVIKNSSAGANPTADLDAIHIKSGYALYTNVSEQDVTAAAAVANSQRDPALPGEQLHSGLNADSAVPISDSFDQITIPKPPPELQPGSTLAERYTIESVLGRGGMGIVYKARHLLMDRQVAIKMIYPQFINDEVVIRRFQAEAKNLSGLSHPNLVAVFDFGITENDEPYMVMDFHNGRSLDELIQGSQRIAVNRGLNIFSQVCDALTAVHGRGIVHRDIKPGNILVAKTGLVKLVDFGIAKSSQGMGANLTKAGQIVGTPSYLSPEQCMCAELDSRSDIYALGCVMYEVFTGRPPFTALSYFEMVRQHVEDVPSHEPFIPALDVSPVLEAIIFKCLAKEPAQRYQSAAQLKVELAALATNT